MNKKRRKVLHSVLDGLERLRDPIDKEEAVKLLQDAQIKVEQCSDEEQDALDGLSDNMRFSARYDNMSDNASDLCGASADLEVLVDDVEQADEFKYESVKPEIVKVVNAIKEAIHR